ncbi:DUF4403 family protein [Flavilitoribacter nigricans]|uniref:DUF4403 family protein n=1 Tax=Flavilitoribacter nigricans (strain ATCC 23147 / DSM 23189 / NBRC 102662 / NCIMB 1420 / SS-2) TaxID=1122177 RepID=A0A2D0MZE6_FLAN2|nr:DUF4403 family protein [Flavilitoribacter nigricans]PHN01550.1 hypothetical protein CRP01_36740 [Flavilitoribacter nigricans DSM 23189 = NBRC 102662]
MKIKNSFLLHLGLFTVISLSLFPACKTTQPNRPSEQYEELFEQGISVVNIPLQFSIRELERMLNKQLDTVLYEDNDINDGDDMMVKAEKTEDITLRLDSNRVAYRVPLDIWVRYNAGIGKVEGTGAVAIELETDYEIKPSWELETHTEILSYEWLEKPRLKMGLVSLPVGFVADLLIDNFKATITENIDQQISANLKLDTLVESAWKKMHEPILVSEEYLAWMMLNPEKISMTPINIQKDELEATILIESKPQLSFGNQPKDPAIRPLPTFEYTNMGGEDFFINVGTQISYQEAQRLAQGAVEGERYEYGKRYVVVEGIELYGQGNKLVVNTTISGTYNGTVSMTGRPEYNANRNSIDIKDLNYTVDSRNFLLKSASWLLKSKFKNMIEANMDFLLEENLKDMESQIKEQLSNYELTENFILDGDLKELNIANAYLAPDGMRVDVALRGKLKVGMKKNR